MALLVAVLVLCSAAPAAAGQNEAAASQTGVQQSESNAAADNYNGLDYTRPQQSAEFRLRFQTSASPTSQTDREVLFLRLTTKIDIPDGWKLGLQTQLPFVDKQVTTSAPTNTTSNAGLGDAFVQAALSRAIDSHWAYGFGARLVSPTAGDTLGTGKWQIMPGFAVRYSFLEINADTYFVPLIRWAFSFAGDPIRPTINRPEFAPTLNIGLPQHWFLTFYPSPDIRVNLGTPLAGQTGRLFLPFDAAIGRKLTDWTTVMLEMSVPIIKEYPVYNFKTDLRISVKF